MPLPLPHKLTRAELKRGGERLRERRNTRDVEIQLTSVDRKIKPRIRLEVR